MWLGSETEFGSLRLHHCGFDMIGFEELNMGTWARLKQVDAVTIFSLSGFGPTFSYGNWLGNDTFQSKPWFN